ncbi:hypothetical protein ACFWGN_20640 [Oerskovia sp. NPDC060338]|uniref:hypothetical protein n=1 Tax=Oerskovia sp. NPDC060338 TaxID=3347100 RepID=UPI003668D8E6
MVPTVAGAVDVVVHLGVTADGKREVREIVGVTGRVEQGVVEVSDLFHRSGGRLVRGDGFPPAEDRFARAGVDLVALMSAQGAGQG